MIYRKLKRVWSHNSMNHIPKFRETFPELNKLSREELCDRWGALGIDCYTEEKSQVQGWIRLTLPFAMILFLLMFVGLPLVFLITGNWSYSNSKNSRIFNWFRQLRMI